jgi:hypothetical protein
MCVNVCCEAYHVGGADLRHVDDRRCLQVRVELGGVGVRNAKHVTRVLDDGDLHAEADAQEGFLVGARVVGSKDLALHPPIPKAS